MAYRAIKTKHIVILKFSEHSLVQSTAVVHAKIKLKWDTEHLREIKLHLSSFYREENQGTWNIISLLERSRAELCMNSLGQNRFPEAYVSLFLFEHTKPFLWGMGVQLCVGVCTEANLQCCSSGHHLLWIFVIVCFVLFWHRASHYMELNDSARLTS